ncbi:MAG: RidA family protein [Thermoanaerobaculia bacterium]
MKPISTDGAPRAIGPYSQAIHSGGFLFTAGQIPLDPATMKLVEGDIDVQAERVFDNLQAVLAEAGLTFSDVVKATVFLLRMSDFAKMNEVYGRRFGSHRPARSTVAVSELPAGARLEIDLVAKAKDGA